MLVEEDPEGITTPSSATLPFETTQDNFEDELETATEIANPDISSNLVDKTPEIIVAEEKVVTLKITEYSDSVVVFRENSPILGLQCEATSEVDTDVKYMWTKNGRFIDTSSDHVTFETHNNGKHLQGDQLNMPI